MGEGTWLIYDLMNYTEQRAIDGLLMLIDFEKVFDPTTKARPTIISCLRKGNKQRHLLKNWRPISLSSVLYKIASSSIPD